MPEGWAWCRLGEICSKLVDGDHNPPKGINEKTEYLMISSRNINHNQVEDLENVRYLTKDIFDTENKRTNLQVGDILFTSVGSLGRSCVYAGGLNLCFQRSVTIIHTNQYNFWLKYYFDSDYYQAYILDNATGTAQLGFYLQQMEKSFIPLPPLAEQERIVSVIQSIFSQIDTLDQNKSDLQTVIKQTKSKILDLAIHGKLVPQDPNDEPAEELLKRIATSDNRPYEKVEEGDIPFEIPPSWKWTTIKNIVNYIGDGDWIESKDQSDKGIRLIQTGNIGFGTFKDKEGKYHYISENTYSSLGCNEIFEGDILISRLPEPVGRACILPKVPERMITAVDCTIIRLNEELFQKELFVYYTISNKYLELIKENCTGTTRLRISRSNLEKIFIPIPPLNEQKRILNRIKELFEALNEIVLNLV